jgi:hypothetical protein
MVQPVDSFVPHSEVGHVVFIGSVARAVLFAAARPGPPSSVAVIYPSVPSAVAFGTLLSIVGDPAGVNPEVTAHRFGKPHTAYWIAGTGADGQALARAGAARASAVIVDVQPPEDDVFDEMACAVFRYIGALARADRPATLLSRPPSPSGSVRLLTSVTEAPAALPLPDILRRTTSEPAFPPHEPANPFAPPAPLAPGATHTGVPAVTIAARGVTTSRLVTSSPTSQLWYTPAFVAGHIVASASPEVLLAASYFNPHGVAAVQALAGIGHRAPLSQPPGPPLATPGGDRLGRVPLAAISASTVTQAVPEATFKQVFEALLREGLVALALVRTVPEGVAAPPHIETLPCVPRYPVINPAADTAVMDDDLILLVLPPELRG